MDNPMYFILLYEYVENMVERRIPFRKEHLALLNEYANRGEVVLGGALNDPMDCSITVFKVGEKSSVEEFVKKDPYIANGLIKSWQIREWNVVVGTEQ